MASDVYRWGRGDVAPKQKGGEFILSNFKRVIMKCSKLGRDFNINRLLLQCKMKKSDPIKCFETAYFSDP